MRPPREFGFPLAGERKYSPEYPCVSRFRQRRLISFLSRQRFSSTKDALIGETDVYMCLKHLTELVQAGQLDDAVEYLSRFLPSDRLLGVYGRALFHFLRLHKAIADIVAGASGGSHVAAALDRCIVQHDTKSHALTKLRAIFSSLLYSKRLRASLNWKRVWTEASSTIVSLIFKTPELRAHMLTTDGPMKPQDVLPIGFGFTSFRPRRHVKKRGRRIPANVLARLYLEQRKKKKLPFFIDKSRPPSSTSIHCQELSRESLIKAKELLVDLVGANLEAGKLREYEPSRYDKGAPVFLEIRGAPVTPVSQANLGTSRRLVCDLAAALHYPAIQWVAYLTEECLEAWPDLYEEYEEYLLACYEDGDSD